MAMWMLQNHFLGAHLVICLILNKFVTIFSIKEYCSYQYAAFLSCFECYTDKRVLRDARLLHGISCCWKCQWHWRGIKNKVNDWSAKRQANWKELGILTMAKKYRFREEGHVTNKVSPVLFFFMQPFCPYKFSNLKTPDWFDSLRA